MHVSLTVKQEIDNMKDKNKGEYDEIRENKYDF